MCLMQTLSNYVIQLNCIIINFTLINMLLRWLQQQELIGEHMTWWLMRIIYKTGLILRLESNMYTLLRFLWHKQCHGIHVFHFLDILKSFDRCDVCNPHLKHKCWLVFLDGLCNTQMLGIKCACSMKKIITIKN